MKHMPVLILSLVLGLATLGCKSTHSYDARLTAADSLILIDAKGAITMLETIPPATLPTDADRAYRDLMLTQAAYKAYVPITDDSAINRALDYYRVHPADREKLTRAYIYKGAVNEELGRPDSAIAYYKQAEASADPDDYFNQGYAKMRMGALYRNNHAMDGTHIGKYEEALKCFNHTDNRHYQLVCMINLGSLYCLKEPLKADSILEQALSLARELGDSVNMVCAAQNIIKNDINRERYVHAHGLVQQVMPMGAARASVPFCLYSAYVYAALQMPDSAEVFLDFVKGVPVSDVMDRISEWEARGRIALARGDSARYLELRNLCRRQSDSLQSLNEPLAILNTEEQIDMQSQLAAQQRQHSTANWITALVLLLILITAASVMLLVRRAKRQRQLLQLLDDSESQLAQMKRSLENIQQFDIKDSKLKEFLDSYNNLTRQVMEDCYRQPDRKYWKRMREVMRFQRKNKDQWEKLYGYIDQECNGIISKTRADYPQLTDKELLFIALTAMDFSYIQIALALDYANASTISSRKLRLARKMGLDGSLNDYIDQFLQ